MHDPQDMSPQYLEDLATGYWHSEVLFTAVEKNLFTRLEPNGKKVVELAAELEFDPATLKRFIHALSVMGLMFEADGLCGNTKLSRKYLVQCAEAYQGDSILWRKFLINNWKTLDRCLEKGTRVLFQPMDEPEAAVKERFRKYCRAMDAVARTKIEEMLPMFSGLELQGEILDVGSGLGAFSVGFLKECPETKATLVDMEQVLEYAAETHGIRSYASRMEYRTTNILEPWALPKKYNLIILSNIVHAFAEAETGHVLAQAVAHLADDGLLLVHDFFMEHAPEKAVLSDLNMLVNTYNGKVYEAAWVREQLEDSGLTATELIPLESDTAVLIASKKAAALVELHLNPVQQLAAKIQSLGFGAVKQIGIDLIEVPEWVGAKCEYGCESFGSAHCPPNCIKPEKTRAMLKNYSKCLLLQGEPPTGDFQRLVLRAERAAFKAGYYKTLSLWAGPCSICDDVCAGEGTCTNHKNARPSMEASGIDVFETVRRAGFSLQTLPEKDDYVKYFAILLLE
jgi:predicted metal-binding protein/cyclopropane fatty-acyl-phospholipid synthase-like methyltransferase